MQSVVRDSLPTKLPRRNLVLARDGAEDWCVGSRCPCGCARAVELLVIDEADPRWDISTDDQRRPTLTPSVWLRDGCRSHFLIQRGRVKWCE